MFSASPRDSWIKKNIKNINDVYFIDKAKQTRNVADYYDIKAKIKVN